MPYYINDVVRVKATFQAAGVNTDPTAITLEYKKPSGVRTILTYGTDAALVKTATGLYQVDLTIDAQGHWHVKWKGTGAVIAAVEDEFNVVRTEFP